MKELTVMTLDFILKLAGIKVFGLFRGKMQLHKAFSHSFSLPIMCDISEYCSPPSSN
jgi:hypothetical protein